MFSLHPDWLEEDGGEEVVEAARGTNLNLPTHRFLSKQAHISAFPLARTKLPVDGGTQFAA